MKMFLEVVKITNPIPGETLDYTVTFQLLSNVGTCLQKGHEVTISVYPAEIWKYHINKIFEVTEAGLK